MSRLRDVRPWHLFAVALVVRLVVVVLYHPVPALTENLRVGMTLAERGYLGNPFALPTGRTAHVAPGYPAFVAATKRLSGNAPRAVLMIQGANAAVAALNIALLPGAAVALGMPQLAGTVAALAWIPPWFRWVETSGEHETMFTTLAVLLLLILGGKFLRRPSVSARHGALFGAAVGVGAHFSPLLFPASLFAALAAIRFFRPRGTARFAVAATLSFLLVLIPYGIRNHDALGGVVFIRDNIGLELAVSNNDRAHPVALLNMKTGGMQPHPYVWALESQWVMFLGELRYNRMRLGEALSWIRENPVEFASLTLRRTGRMLFPYSSRLYQSLLGTFITMLFLLGLWFLPGQDRHATWIICAFVAGYSAIYLFVQHDIRYWYPMLLPQSLVAGAMVLRPMGRSRQQT
jgi:hypothetical protein